MMHLPPSTHRRLPPLLVLIAITTACGGDGGATADLSELGREGRQITLDNGCAACHGSDGGGGVGPPYVGAFGRTVTLDDGSTVTADREYLARSIREPDAQIVDGYGLQMPTNNLDDDQIDAVVQYIVELSADTGSAP